MLVALDILALSLIAVTLLPLVPSPAWWIRVWDFPRVQVTAAIALVGPALWLVDNPGSALTWTLLVALVAAAAVQLVRIFPYTPLAPLQVPRAEPQAAAGIRLRILLANVLEPNRNADTLLGIIEAADPDLVLAVETDAFWDERLATLAPRFPHRLCRPQANTYGMHLFSRLPLHDAAFRCLIDPDVPSVLAEVELRSGARVAFFGVHPRPPRVAQDTDARDAELVVVGQEARSGQLPAIVAGDLNDVAWSQTTRLFQRISGLLDPRIGRGLYATFHARIPLLRWPLDHLFHGPDFRLVELRRLPAFGSDHFPVLVELAHVPAKAASVEVPEAAPGDHSRARRIARAVPAGARRLREAIRRR